MCHFPNVHQLKRRFKGQMILLLISLFRPSFLFAENLVVIVNENSPVFATKKTLELQDIQDVCLGKMRFWGNEPVKQVNQKDRKLLETFVNGACRMKLSEYQHYWTKRMLNEGLRAPLSLSSSADVIEHVQKERGGIGYILKSEAGSVQGIKVIYTMDLAP